jgi:uncharacterized protein YndB with AHSA1/START domain
MKHQLRVAARAKTKARVELVWSMVSDAEQYAHWGPWDGSGYESPGVDDPHGVGATRWMQLGRTRTVEEILELEPIHRVVYTVVRGIPVRNYRAEVILDAEGGGTDIQWSASWDNTFLGRIVHRRLATFYPEMMGQLVAAADRKSFAGIDGE